MSNLKLTDAEFYKWFSDSLYQYTLTQDDYKIFKRESLRYLKIEKEDISTNMKFDADFVFLTQIEKEYMLIMQNEYDHGQFKLDLTFEENGRHSVYFPSSTWAEGRNMLLFIMLLYEKYNERYFRYWIFRDGDLHVADGNYKTGFE
eukprot:UN26481